MLAAHGGVDDWPLYYSDLAENGNYLEPEEIAVRKGACGDPRLVRALIAQRLALSCQYGSDGIYANCRCRSCDAGAVET